MSTPVVALALAAMCALFSAAAADTAQAIGLRNHAANEARRVATSAIDSCALGSSPQGCEPPAGCANQACTVCRRGDAVQADVSLEWSPTLLKGLAPARGRHALSLDALNVADLAGAALPACDSTGSAR